ncbi:FMN reductase [Micromonospora andamanensis]|uniref:FMN reductase n=1 Tax=Micromonospora andamanensis TaxID=1287068 RepID=A0ABQ4HWV9_9ACTN|nr:FMN reductase [Micromonospora andamanensis]GIJ10142.1 FMN reductase [Micromonospora andamanensis]
MTTRTIAVVSAGLSQPSSTRLLADQLAAATRDELVRHGEQVALRPVELREHAHDIVNHLLTGFPSEPLKQVLDEVTAADGLIAVSPIFNASYNGLFKSFFDLLDADTLGGRAVLIGATGGTARHSLALEHALRPMFTYLRAVVAPTAVFAAPEDWSGGAVDGALSARIGRAGRELAELVRRSAPSSGPADPFALTTSFDQLLRGQDA